MCGIFGIFPANPTGVDITRKDINDLVNTLFHLSESRGREASGIAFLHKKNIYVSKHSICASDMLKDTNYKNLFQNAFALDSDGNKLQAIIGHSRLVTNGSQYINNNNQPVVKDGIVGIHNGIITNIDDLWKQFSQINRQYDIDTEILLSLIRMYTEKGMTLTESVCQTYQHIEGVVSICLLFVDINASLISTNNGSLYIGTDENERISIFASEKYILQKLAQTKTYRNNFKQMNIKHLPAGKGMIFYFEPSKIDTFSLAEESGINNSIRPLSTEQYRVIEDVSPNDNQQPYYGNFRGQGPYIPPRNFIDEYPQNHDAINKLRRCTKCILPETMPFIEFDSDGVCNYCRNYKSNEMKGINALIELVEPFRNNTDVPDCLVTFSGGRDSSYGLHFVKNELNLNPVTYTYDWGMVTDLARRNQMRMCGKLGVEHILVSADLRKKRSFIRQNVLAWLKSPNLGTVPLFMAGDKQYFYYANKICKQVGCKLIFLCENPLETTRFKTGFCGVPPRHGTRQTYALSKKDRATIAFFYGWQYIRNPAYLNVSIIDTLWAYACYYFISHPYVNLYEYVKWEEDEISSTLIQSYNWETAKDTKSTWRIGDGTAAFYNYIYYTIGGLTENDTLRSNQIREGMISRTEALKLSDRDNEPRYDSIQWYCDIIGIDFHQTIKTINSTPKLYANH